MCISRICGFLPSSAFAVLVVLRSATADAQASRLPVSRRNFADGQYGMLVRRNGVSKKSSDGSASGLRSAAKSGKNEFVVELVE